MLDGRRVAISFTTVVEETADDAAAIREIAYSLGHFKDLRHLEIRVLGIVPRKKDPSPDPPMQSVESVGEFPSSEK